MKLNRTPNPLDRNARNGENDNWDIIEDEVKKVTDVVDDFVGTVTDEVVGELIDQSKLNRKEPVASFDDLPSGADVGDTIMTRDDGKVYRYDGSSWQWIEQIDATAINEVDSRLTSRLEYMDCYRKRISINIEDFGSVGNGLDDDSGALIDAISFLRDAGGGKLVFPPGDYMIRGTFTMISNFHLEIMPGAVIRPFEKGLIRFHYPSYSKGYGGGVSNIVIDGGGAIIFPEDSGGGKLTNAMHHNENIIIRDLTIISQIKNGHIFDLCGCRNVVFDNIVFKCHSPSESKLYSEIIQIDRSAEGGLSYSTDDDILSIDSLPTTDVSVTDCTFSNFGELKTGSPIGSHATTISNYKNIVFKNNKVINPIDINGSSHGVIHLQSIVNLTIDNNTFISDLGSSNRILSIKDGSGDEVSSVIKFTNNIISNFVGDKSLVDITGYSKESLIDKINVSGNLFENPSDETEVIIIRNFKDAVISYNEIRDAFGLLFIGYGENLNMIRNYVYDCNRGAVSSGKSSSLGGSITFSDNHFKGVLSSGYLFADNVISIKDNVIDDPKSKSQAVSATADIVMISDNVSATVDTSYFANLEANKAIITNNMLSGFSNIVNVNESEGVIITNNVY